jgi:RluA family pseudouridine synthase
LEKNNLFLKDCQVGLPILFEDKHIIAINKDHGISVIPGRGKDDKEPLIKSVEKMISNKAFVVHRIDKETSGVVLFAKDPSTHRHLNMQFEKREIKKEYISMVMGNPLCNQTIDSPIYEFGSGRMGVDKRGKPSSTEVVIEKQYPGSSLLRVFPCTGRRHQIRVHLYSIGHPILGDSVYGNPRPVGGVKRLMLHAKDLCFMHPNGTPMTISAPVNDAWNEVFSQINS